MYNVYAGQVRNNYLFNFRFCLGEIGKRFWVMQMNIQQGCLVFLPSKFPHRCIDGGMLLMRCTNRCTDGGNAPHAVHWWKFFIGRNSSCSAFAKVPPFPPFLISSLLPTLPPTLPPYPSSLPFLPPAGDILMPKPIYGCYEPTWKQGEMAEFANSSVSTLLYAEQWVPRCSTQVTWGGQKQELSRNNAK